MNDIDLLDVLNVLSFYIGLKNLDENLSQGKAEVLLENAVKDIHNHLQKQDEKLERLGKKLNEIDKKAS